MGHLCRHFQRLKRPSKFWTLMGPLFAEGTIRRELQTLHDNPSSDEWFVWLSDESVDKFACLRIKGDSAELCHYWVREQGRGKRQSNEITKRLLARARELGLERAHIVATESLVKDLKKHGFSEGTSRGKYTRMEMTL